MGKLEKIAVGLNFAEGPAWSSTGILYVSNCYGDWIAQIKQNRLDTFVVRPTQPDTFNSTNGLTMAKDGYLYACDFGVGAVLRFNMQGECFIYAASYKGEKFNRPNDLAFDPNGNLYFTDPNKYDKEQKDGRIFRIDHETAEVVLVAENLAFPNGIAFSADAKSLYICESALSRILKYTVNNDGSLGNRTVFVSLPNGDPDGIAFDRKENLYAAYFGTGTVFVIDPAGTIISEIKIPDGKKTTNVEFGGPDMHTLYITDAESNAVYKIRNSVPGLKLFYTN
jgi:gluconolactonase